MGDERTFPTGSDRDRVLSATAQLCSEIGYQDLRVAEIAERAGVSEKRLHELFQDEQAAVAGAIDAILGAVMEALGAFYSPDRSEVESYMLSIKSMLETMAANPAFAHVSFVASRQMTPQALKARYTSGIGMLALMLERLRDSSSGDLQPPLVARAGIGGAEAVIRREVAYGRTADLPTLLPDFIYTAAVPFLGQAEAMRLVRRSRELLDEQAPGTDKP
jgi:AcrR family transcriptional regulator